MALARRLAVGCLVLTLVTGAAHAGAPSAVSSEGRFGAAGRVTRWLEITITEQRDGKPQPADYFTLALCGSLTF